MIDSASGYSGNTEHAFTDYFLHNIILPMFQNVCHSAVHNDIMNSWMITV